ncbi:sodium channel protein 60E [Acrasis kona]|uniref:Sodium channel protein 60E n=1 Tax=Acrasis kona TaxID=1008807 RepID=A0AAW2ZAU9_9EUKA
MNQDTQDPFVIQISDNTADDITDAPQNQMVPRNMINFAEVAESPHFKRIRHLKVAVLIGVCLEAVYTVVMIVVDGLQLTQWYANTDIDHNLYTTSRALFWVHLTSCILILGVCGLGLVSISPLRPSTQKYLVSMVAIGPSYMKAGYGCSIIPMLAFYYILMVLSGLRSVFIHKMMR